MMRVPFQHGEQFRPDPRTVQKLYPAPAWNGIALELLGANREK